MIDNTEIKVDIESLKKDVENVNPKTQAIRIARTVGDKKREIIVQKADEMGIRVFNRRDL